MELHKTLRIEKVIIPAAGLGTRFLPLTKSVPKELIPILNRPALEYIVEEALQANLNNFFIITRKDKEALAKHFDSNAELELFLQETGRDDLLKSLNSITRSAQFTYVRQPEPQGLGHALWSARHSIGKEHVAVMLPDDIIINRIPALTQLIKVARQERGSILAVQEVPLEQAHTYGMIDIRRQLSQNLFQVSSVIEKPDAKDAPSNLAIVGRYVLSHKIFQSLEEIDVDAKGELQLTDAIAHMIRNGEKVYAYKIEGMRYDIGTPVGWVKAIIGCALQDPQFAPHVRSMLENKELLDQFMYNPIKIIQHTL